MRLRPPLTRIYMWPCRYWLKSCQLNACRHDRTENRTDDHTDRFAAAVRLPDSTTALGRDLSTLRRQVPLARQFSGQDSRARQGPGEGSVTPLWNKDFRLSQAGLAGFGSSHASGASCRTRPFECDRHSSKLSRAVSSAAEMPLGPYKFNFDLQPSI
jgi:hypothetical protein